MEKSPTISELAKALNRFQGEMGTVVFDAVNPFFKSKYATLSALVATARPILFKNELSVSQLTEGDGGVTTILMHSSGEYISSTLILKAVKDDPQGKGSAITYARRYAYASILGIVSDEDDDGNASSSHSVSLVNDQQLHEIRDLLISKEISETELIKYMKLDKLENMKASDYQKAINSIKVARKATIKQ